MTSLSWLTCPAWTRTPSRFFEKNVLSIRGYPNIEIPDGYSPAYAEYETGDYVRSFNLSDQIDQEHISATVNEGVLRLTLPKSAPAKAKTIEVKAA